MLSSKAPRRVLAVLACVPFFTGCATQQMIEEYEGRIVSLQEEKRGLNLDLNNLRGRNSELERMLAEREVFAAPASAGQRDPLPDIGSGVTIDYNENGLLTITIPSSITFSSGSAELSTGGQAAVRSVAAELNSPQYSSARFSIEGHTDTDRPSKSKSKFPTNRLLSLARAQSVHEFLVNQCAVPDEKCVVAGHGEYKPISPDKAANRRVEIIVHPNG